MRTLSLFSGIGGLDLGFQAAGFDVVQMCEQDPFCRAVLSERFPGVSVHDDVRTLGRADAPVLDGVRCIIGGFPCQGISAAGRGEGLADERSALWFECLRVIELVRPDWVCIENVAALRTRGADVVFHGLEEAGYAWWASVVGSVHAGAPHRRQRVFIVAHLADADDGGGGQDSEPSELRAGRTEQPPGVGRASDSTTSPEGRRAGRGPRAATMADSDRDGRGSEREPQYVKLQSEARHFADRRDSRGRWQWPSGPHLPPEPWEEPRAIEPGMGRAADGIPPWLESRERKERLRALGNAVSPPVAEAVGRAIMRIAEGEKDE